MAAVVAALAVGALATLPPELDYEPEPEPPPAGSDIDARLAADEDRVAAASGIIEGTRKRIRWYRSLEGKRTALSVVYVHGFSATRQETAPLAERVADELGANLFETRLAGHGLERAALAGISAENWLDDMAESLAVGSELGERMVLIGTSTGATLILAARELAQFRNVVTLVFISPNFAPKDGAAEWLLGPYGPQLGRLLAGETRTWTAANDRQARYWSTSYPLDAAVEMMRLVERVRSSLPMALDASLLVFYSPQDEVVDVNRIETSVGAIAAPRVELVAVEGAGDPSSHVLAGEILSPATTDRLVAETVAFVLGRPR